ncbi:glycosyltransferase family 4 protein [Marinobacter caseinilyticus]|uniref:glycosyltransferase family 4 protein n=1 Tax=Marinobacter caseinilyticus TaxID=2692195 RepID=UPI00140BBFD5|nr:glycosyltransferase family 4 protein [Marinobacter caseinilyticus]
MKLLVLSQYFWPENFIINDLVRTLVAQGHSVTVVTGKPNYPDGVIYSGYKAGGVEKEYFADTAEVIRIPIWPRGKGGGLNLLLNYLSFIVSGWFLLPWLLRKHDFDAILVFAPSPVTQVIPAFPIKWLKGARLVLWVQDLWPESLEATGFVQNRVMLSLVGAMVRLLYAGCDRLLVQSEAFIKPASFYAKKEKIHYYPNSIKEFTHEKSQELPSPLVEILESNFCLVFAGNLGTAQALDTIVDAAKALKNETHLKLVLVGSGSRSAWLTEQKITFGLDNLVLPGRFPPEAMPEIYRRASVLLVSLTDKKVFSQTIPSKVQAYLAAGKPIIACMNGEGARVVKEASAGLATPAEQVGPLLDTIRKMHSLDETVRAAMGAAGREYFRNNFEMEQQAKRLVSLLLENELDEGS